MVDSVDDLKTSQSMVQQTHWPNFELLDARFASSLNKIIQLFHLQEEGQSGGTKKAQKEDRFSLLKTDRLHDLRLLPGYWRSR